MIFTQEAPLPRKWFSGRSCILSNWSKVGVNFEKGGNRSTRRKPSKSSWDLLKLNPHTAFVIEVEGVIGVHYASLTSQGVQHRVFYLDGHPSRYQPRPTGLNFGEQTGTCVFPLVIAVNSFVVSVFVVPPTASKSFLAMSKTRMAEKCTKMKNPRKKCANPLLFFFNR